MIHFALLFALSAVPSHAWMRYQPPAEPAPPSVRELQAWAEAKTVARSELARPVRELVAAASAGCARGASVSVDERGIVCAVLKESWRVRIGSSAYDESVLVAAEALAARGFYPSAADGGRLRKGNLELNLMSLYHIVEADQARRVRAARVRAVVEAGIP